MRCHIKIQTINDLPVMRCLFAQRGSDGVLYTLSILVAVVVPFFYRPGHDVLPEPLKLRIAEGTSFPVGNHEIRFRACFCFLQTRSKTFRKWDISFCGFCF